MATLIRVEVCVLRKHSWRAREEENKWQIGGKSNHRPLSLFPSTAAVQWCLYSANYSFREPEENPTVQKQSLSLIRERNEVLQNVIGYSCCQIARQLPIRTFIDNMWIGTRARRLLPMDTPLVGLTCLQMYKYTKWPTARGSLLAVAMCG